MLRHDILSRYILSSRHFARVCQVTIPLELCSFAVRSYILAHAGTTSPLSTLYAPRGGVAMAVEIAPHPGWVADLDATLEPSRQAILDTPVIVDASENQLIDGQIQNFLVAFY